MVPHKILLLTSYPPGLYQYGIDKALRQSGHEVHTVGSTGTLLADVEQALKRYDPDYRFDRLVAADEPLEQILADCPFAPDLILYLESGIAFLPQGLAEAPCPVVGLLSEDYLHADWYAALFPYFDLALCTWKSSEDVWRAHGYDNVRQWYYGARPSFCVNLGLPRIYDVAFLGNLNPSVQRRRLPSVQKVLRLRDEGVNVYIGTSLYFEDYNRIHAQAKIVYHRGITDQVNMRVFEAMGAGCLVVMPRPQETNDPTYAYFCDREEVVFADSDEDALALIRHYLTHDGERQRIAAAGQRTVMARHNYWNRLQDLFAGVLPTLPADFLGRRRDRLARFGKDERRQHLDYGRFYLKFGALDACFRQLQALTNAETDPEALNLAGVLAATAGDGDAALQFLERAAMDPDAVLARVNHAAVRLALKHPDAEAHAEAALAALAAVDPAGPPSALEGICHPLGYERYAIEVAHTHFRHPSGPTRNVSLARLYGYHLHTLLGRSDLDRDRPLEALREFDRALELVPDDGYVRYDRARALHALGRVHESVVELRHAVKHEPFFAQAQLDLATVAEGLGMHEEAFEHGWDLVRHNPLFAAPADLWQHVGELALQLGKRADALYAFERALALAPENEALQRRVAELQGNTKATIVMAVDADARLFQRAIVSLQEHTDADTWELVLIQRGESAALAAFLGLLQKPPIVIPAGPSATADHVRAAQVATGSHLVFLDERLAVQPGWLAPLLQAASDRFLSAPIVLDESGALATPPDACVCLPATLWKELGGFTSSLPLADAIADLKQRASQLGASIGVVSDSTAVVRDVPVTPPRASIIVLAWNQLEYTQECVESIREWTRGPYELILVDNGSIDGTLEYFRSVPGATVVANGSNLGFAAGNNRGIEVATADYVVLLNNDTIVTDGWLDGLMTCAQEDPAIGLVGPMSNYVSGPQLVREPAYEDRGQLEAFARAFRAEGRGQRIELERVVGFCMLITRPVLNAIGGLDESFGLGNFEDDDYCVRARQAGFRLVAAADVFIHHFGSRTFIGEGIDVKSAIKQGQEVFMDKWQGCAESAATLALALEDDPANASLWNDLACAHANAGKRREAEECLRKAAEVGVGEASALAHRNLGALYCQDERWHDAIAAYQASLRAGFDLDTLVTLSQCCLKIGAGEAALLGFRRVLELAPTHPMAQAGLVVASQLAYPPSAEETGAGAAQTAEAFHRAWYDAGVWNELSWFGLPIRKNPFDLFQYQEIITEQRPDVIIECGAHVGGSTLYFAHLLDLLGDGKVISVEIEGSWHASVVAHPRVVALQGSSTAPEVLARIRQLVPTGARAFVILDSDHRAEHVLAELRAYQAFVQVGNYLIAEDSNINGHPVLPGWGPGPFEAVEAFLRENPRFAPDREREKKLRMTFAPSGWLKRIS